jgi:SAM-dependent methyltransferase
MSGNRNMHGAWHEKQHARDFDGWNLLNRFGLKKTFESFSEIKLLLELKHLLKGRELLEVGCATGELCRYLKQNHPSFKYAGLDISRPAIDRAKEKYPSERFYFVDENKSVSEQVEGLNLKPSVLFARDVVLHQPNPFEFMADILSIAGELAILRLRTRDKGETVLDTEASCQFVYDKWVPFMILNIDEVIDMIRKRFSFEALYIVKCYVQMGGHNARYLPKDCYYRETGTAETAICLVKSDKKVDNPKISIREAADSRPGIRNYDLKPAKLLKMYFK